MTSRRGFTLPELLIVMSILAVLFGLVSLSLLGGQHQLSVASSLSQLIADAKLQQSKAMWGDTEGRDSTDSYGIYLNSNQYILFHGSAYSAGDPDNVVIDLDSGAVLSPIQSFIFAKGSGEIMNYDPDADTITISSISDSKTLEFNQYGVITRND